MKIKKIESCEVLVVGAGIAGILAAITAAGQGASVILAASTRIFSGSSFYPGTWGLGLIGPESQADEEDLIQSILRVGCGMADERLVRAFVPEILPSIEYLKSLGVQLKKAENQDQKDFIPCFDHKHRAWNGILFDSAKEVLGRKLEELSVQQLPDCQLIELVKEENRIRGAIVKLAGGLGFIRCRALVLATGGYGGLFKDRLTTDDVCGMGQYLAFKHGCSLINMEFMQIMPGYRRPCPRTIFNEKTFRYTALTDADGRDIFDGTELHEDQNRREELLKLRSAHGPFTSRLPSREVDFAIVRARACSDSGVTVTYREAMKQDMPEFIRTYFDWLKEKKGLTVEDEIHIGMFAHAANGGIWIRPDTATEVPGLFACGEVTGGMHGADRIGGLSTANGLVFGRRAGMAAARYAKNGESGKVGHSGEKTGSMAESYEETELCGRGIKNVSSLRETMRETMSAAALVIRSDTGLRRAKETGKQLLKACEFYETEDPVAIADANLLLGQLKLSLEILSVEQLRTESRGSHYREDYPSEDPQLCHPIVIRKMKKTEKNNVLSDRNNQRI